MTLCFFYWFLFYFILLLTSGSIIDFLINVPLAFNIWYAQLQYVHGYVASSLIYLLPHRSFHMLYIN